MRTFAAAWSIFATMLYLPLFPVGAQQSAPADAAPDPNFVIDQQRPYVYLELDHVGPRKPLREGEPSTGLWLHLRNNCKVPIIVLAIKGPSEIGAATITFQDEVVPNREAVGEVARGGAVFAPRELKNMLENMDDIIRFPNKTEDEVRSAEEAQRNSKSPPQRPLGYNSYNGFDNFEFIVISPGGSELLSVPANHVSKSWHFEIPLRFAVPNKSKIRPPYSYVAYYQEDLDRAQRKSTSTTTR